MRKVLAVVGLVLMFAFPAQADEATCVQTDGQIGVYNGSTTDDEGCITVAEYEVKFPGMIDTQLVVGPDPEPEAITIRQWFDNTFRTLIGPR